MPILTLRMLDGTTLSADTSLSAVVDLGEFLSLDIIGTISQAGVATPATEDAVATLDLVAKR